MKNFPKCEDCHRLGHTIDLCWKLHVKSPRLANVVHASVVDPPPTGNQPQATLATYKDFPQWFESRQSPGATTSVARIGNSNSRVTQSPLGP